MDLLGDFLVYLRDMRSYSPHTVIAYETDIRQFGAFCEGIGIGFSDVAAQDARMYVGRMRAGGIYCEASINRAISSLRTFYGYLLDKESVTENPFEGSPFVKIRLICRRSFLLRKYGNFSLSRMGISLRRAIISFSCFCLIRGAASAKPCPLPKKCWRWAAGRFGSSARETR